LKFDEDHHSARLDLASYRLAESAERNDVPAVCPDFL
jgi:hypothetical protein